MPLVCGYGGPTHRPLVADALCDYPDCCNGLLLASLAGPSRYFTNVLKGTWQALQKDLASLSPGAVRCFAALSMT